MSQRLVFVPAVAPKGIHGVGSAILDVGEAPERVWTLVLERDEGKPPSLPFRPQHGHNAWLEDAGHDWRRLGRGRLKYTGRGSSSGGVWLLLEG